MDFGLVSVHVVLVDYFKGGQVARLVSELASQAGVRLSICVLDNSVDPDNFKIIEDSVFFSSAFSRFDLIACEKNYGYSIACNMGANIHSDWDYVLFLNPDINLMSVSTIQDCVSAMADFPAMGCCGVAQKNPDGSWEPVARKFPSLAAIAARRIKLFSRLFSESLRGYINQYDNAGLDSGSLQEGRLLVNWLQSSFFLVDRQCWEAVGGFDERYFVFMADVDFCRSAWLAKFEVALLRNVIVGADGVRSSGGGLSSIFINRPLRIHLFDALKYYLKKF